MIERLDIGRVPAPILKVVGELKGAGHQAWLVGGGVRDLLRSQEARPPEDWDVATSARPEQVMSLFRKVIPTGVKHGTVTVLIRGHSVEVTTFRGEAGYSDARRPDRIEFLDRIEEDLARRDFTVNAIAWDPFCGEVRDPYEGMKDLEAGILRAVRDPVERFTEDGLRPMRAVRFACVLGIDVERATLSAIPKTIPSFRKVAVERMRQELEKILRAERPSVAFELMAQTGLLGVLLPELTGLPAEEWCSRMRALDAAAPDASVSLTILLGDVRPATGEPLDPGASLERLRFSKAEIAAVRLLASVRAWREYTAARPAALRRVLAAVGRERAGQVADLWCALAEGEGGPGAMEHARESAAALIEQARSRLPVEVRELAVSGRDVMAALEVSGGPIVGRAMAYLLDLVLEEPEMNERERLLAALHRWRQREGS